MWASTARSVAVTRSTEFFFVLRVEEEAEEEGAWAARIMRPADLATVVRSARIWSRFGDQQEPLGADIVRWGGVQISGK